MRARMCEPRAHAIGGVFVWEVGAEATGKHCNCCAPKCATPLASVRRGTATRPLLSNTCCLAGDAEIFSREITFRPVLTLNAQRLFLIILVSVASQRMKTPLQASPSIIKLDLIIRALH